MNDVEISPNTGKRIKVAAWISAILGLLLFYVFGYFPLLMWFVHGTSLLDSLSPWVETFIKSTLVPLIWLMEVFPVLESYYDKFTP